MPDKLAGRTLGDFRLDELVGRGSSGKVYRATQLSLRRTVAVKVLEEGLFTLPEMKDRFVREAEFIARLEHPNIIPVYAAGNEGNLYFFAMRFVEGSTLAERMTRGMPVAEGIRHLADIAAALSYAHARGILHRDVKPANIMIADGAAVLADFGLARLLEQSTITASSAMLGTPLYRSPEAKPTFRSDLYALGVILYEIATGRHPYAPAGRDELIARVRAGVYDPPADPAVAEVVARAMRMEYAAAGEMQRDLLALRVAGDVTIAPPTEPQTQLADTVPAEARTLEGKAFGKFVLLSKLGHGGMGVVYEAEQPDLGRRVALKVLLHQEDESLLQRFLGEARSAARLRHPNIVPIHEVGQIDGTHYFTMDFIEGKDLDAKMPVPPRRAVEILRDVARAIQYAHEQGVIHRDLKPANILVEKAGRPLVTDFGLAKDLKEARRLTVSGEVFGTPAYMAPEQALGKPGPLSDVYALGAVLYHLVAGRPPHEGASPMDVMLSVLGNDPPSVRRLNPNVHRDLETICHKAMEKDPKLRYGSAAAFADDCGRFLQGEPIQARPAGFVTKLFRRVARHRKIVAAVLITLIVLAGSGVAWRQVRNRRALRELRPRAEAAYSEQRLADAAELYRQILDVDPGDAAARVRKEECERRLARAQELLASIPFMPESGRIALCSQILEQDPRRALAWAHRGFAGLQIRTVPPERVKADLEKAIELDPDEPLAHLGLAIYYQRHEIDRARARDHLYRASRRGSGDFAGGLALAEFLLEDDPARSLEILDGLERSHRHPFVYHARGNALHRLGRGEEAFQDYSRASQLDPHFVQARLSIALFHLERGEHDEAKREAEAVVKIDPTSAAGYVVLAAARFRLGDLPGVASAMEEAKRYPTNDPTAHLLAAELFLDMYLPASAYPHLEHILKIHPENVDALLALAGALQLDRRYEEAEERVRSALRLKPDYAPALVSMGALELARGRPAEALPWIDRAQNLDPKNEEARSRRALILIDLKRYDEALREGRALTGDPTGKRAFGIGQMFLEHERLLEAEEFLSAAIARGHVRGYLYRGVARQKQLDFAGAVADHETVLALDSDSKRTASARTNLDQIAPILPHVLDPWRNRGEGSWARFRMRNEAGLEKIVTFVFLGRDGEFYWERIDVTIEGRTWQGRKIRRAVNPASPPVSTEDETVDVPKGRYACTVVSTRTGQQIWCTEDVPGCRARFVYRANGGVSTFDLVDFESR